MISHIRLLNTLKTTFTLLFLLFVNALMSQTDTEFWFVAPEASSGHGDSPIVLRVSAFTGDADINLSMPANPGFTPIVLTIPAGNTESIDLTAFMNQIENQPANQVLNKGLKLSSSVPVTAYYEVNSFVNPEIFALKGSNALGLEFYTPFPSTYNNGTFSPMPQSGFDIVATQNNTVVTIVPTTNLVGHPAGVPFSVTLQAGETYSCLAASAIATERPIGTRITSNKPIGVTLKDDSASLQGCRDLMGDQLVPTGVIGTEYIVMRGFLNSGDRAFILATANNTDIFIDGSATPVATINAGEQYSLDILTPSVYITSSNPVYVLHATGFGCELGSAILPSIECTGSSAVIFTRSTSEQFGLNIMVRPGSEGSFVLNGSTTLVTAASFTAVPGAGGQWLSAQLTFSEFDVPVGTTSVLANTSSGNELFHLGIIHGGTGTGCRYGYFSDFASTYLGDSRTVCVNDSIQLDAGGGKDSYLWNTGDTSQVIWVDTPGEYWVLTIKDGCETTDTVQVVEEDPIIDFGQNISICEDSVLVLNPGTAFSTFNWQDNSTNSTFTVNAPGTYWVEAFTSAGCRASDTVSVAFQPIPPMLNLQFQSPVCEGSTTVFEALGVIGDLNWSGPNNFSATEAEVVFDNVLVNQGGAYTAVQIENGCASPPATFTLQINPSASVQIDGDTLICADTLALLTASGLYNGLQWSNGETGDSIEVQAGEYSVIASNNNGCNDTAFVNVLLAQPLANFSVDPPSQVVQLGNPFVFTDSTQVAAGVPIDVYAWDLDDGTLQTGNGLTYTYADTGTYTVVMVVTNEIGCIDTVSKVVKVIDGIVIPNAFSPNGDGKNDVLKIGNLEAYENPNLRIYNRWGVLLYQSDNYQNDWDGGDVPDGTYFYVLLLPTEQQDFKGTVFIAR